MQKVGVTEEDASHRMKWKQVILCWPSKESNQNHNQANGLEADNSSLYN